jgi:hypothetical protein
MLLLMLSGTYVYAKTASIVKKHPVEVTSMPNCRDCHTDKWQAFNHQAPTFFEKHRYYAQDQRLACAACHKDSYCSDCHAHREEIKPSDKYAGSPTRNLPHRGDFLSQHMIDGQINPASCAKCHGRQNNEGCKVCHR